MVLEYDIDKLNAVLGDFYLATGVNISLYDENFVLVGVRRRPSPRYCLAVQAKHGSCTDSDITLLKQCQREKKLRMHRCHAGLLDIAVPILYGEIILGYIIFGQIKTEADFSAVREKIARLSLDTDEMAHLYGELPYMENEKIRSIASIAEILARHIMLENMMKPHLFSDIDCVTEYIRTHLHERISVKTLCAKTHLSAGVLYRKFHSRFGCTVNEYINTKRVEEAVGLLQNTDLSIEGISERVGFSDASYFSRVFKQKMGASPLKFRTSLTKR